MPFEWDPVKDQVNRERHGISFEEASELFKSGDDYLEIYDEEHSDDEERFVAIDRSVPASSWSATRNDRTTLFAL